MIDNYNKLSKIITEHFLSVAYRYVSHKPEGFYYIFTPEEIIQAFKDEGFKSREDIWKRITDDFPQVLISHNSVHTGGTEIINDEELREATHLGVYCPPRYKLTRQGIMNTERKLEKIYDGNILSKKPLAEQLGLVEEGTVPAADRIVKLDHNSEPHKESIEKLDELIEEAEEKNEPKYQQAAAHLKAAKALLEAPQLREKDKQTIKEWFEWLKREITSATFQTSLDKLLAFLLGLF
ncbi:MAG: hypothetical protein ACR2PV_09155 [Gammaproteobacteria bacterium]